MSSNPTGRVASSTEGFFQEAPHLENQFLEDASLRHALALFIPDDTPPKWQQHILSDLTSFGDRVLSSSVLSLVKDAEHNLPRLETWDTFGRRKDELITSNGWKKLQVIGQSEGIVAIPYEGAFRQCSRLYQFFKYHLWSASNALTTCPAAMTDGAASLLKRHLRDDAVIGGDSDRRAALDSALKRLTSRDPSFAWTSGQWMTERAGGSDVRNTETRAKLLNSLRFSQHHEASDGSSLGHWSIDGFKWFSSATDANMTVLLAKTYDESRGLEELSAFFAPTRQKTEPAASSNRGESSTVTNGVYLQRLKTKLGTKPLPTAELELRGMRAHLLGQVGQGVREIATVLNITRVHNAVSSMGNWGRGLAIARAFSRTRRVGGKLLVDVPAHMRDLAREHVKYRGYMLFTFFAVALLGIVEHHADTGEFTSSLGLHSAEHAAILLRLLTPILKAHTALAAIDGLRWTMESLGGIGYLENEDPALNVARLFRDTNVLAIWEGTTNVMAGDTLRVLQSFGPGGKSSALEELEIWIQGLFGDAHAEMSSAVENIRSLQASLTKLFESRRDRHLLNYHGRDFMDTIDRTVVTILLYLDASSHTRDFVTRAVFERWQSPAAKSSNNPGATTPDSIRRLIEVDRAIVLENTISGTAIPSTKL